MLSPYSQPRLAAQASVERVEPETKEAKDEETKDWKKKLNICEDGKSWEIGVV